MRTGLVCLGKRPGVRLCILPALRVIYNFKRAGPPGEEDVHRTTLVFAFWDDTLKPALGQPGSGPALLPPWGRRQANEITVKRTAPRRDDSCESAQPQPTGACSGQNRALLVNCWLADMKLPHPPSSADPCIYTTMQQTSDQVAVISPVWLRVEQKLVEENRRHNPTAEGLKDAQLPPLKFFLRSESEIYNTYNPVSD